MKRSMLRICLLVFAMAATAQAADASGDPSIITINLGMFTLFLLTFMLAAFVLNKYAFGPILGAIDEREERIANSIEQAEEVEAAHANIENFRDTIIGEADEKAKSILDDARKGGNELKRLMEEEGKEEARILRENAERDIASAEEKAKADLRRESADLAVQLARNVLGQELKTNGDAYVSKLIKDL